MRKTEWYRLYGRLENITPLADDCGRLCGKKCCSPREEGLGIYLFPGEEKLFPGGEGWYRVMEYGPGAEYFTGDRGLMISCTGMCPRERRPMACRLFPMAPYINKAGQLEIIYDRDALFICPLVRSGDVKTIDRSFLEAVRQVWEELAEEGEVRESVLDYSARTDRQAADPWMNLFAK